MQSPVKISIVGYTNTIPFVYGLRHFFSEKEIDLSLDIPSLCAEKTVNGKADIGLMPAAMLSRYPDLKIASDFCIGAVGKVDSVMLYSTVPLNEIKTILLDYQSRTSVELVKVLCRELWKTAPEFQQTSAGFEEQISGKTAAVIIGDRTFSIRNKYAFVYDLAECWMQLTGLPFAFAVWATSKELPPEFAEKFNNALRYGVENTDKAIAAAGPVPGLTNAETEFYLNQRISYHFDKDKRDGLQHFLNFLRSRTP